MKYLEKEFYSVEEEKGQKLVHIHGYVYDAGGSINEEKPDETYRCIDISWGYIPIEEFVGMTDEEVYERINRCKQSIDDLTEEGAIEVMENYYEFFDENLNGENNYRWSGTELPFSEITVDTPCGDYVNYKKKEA